MLAAEIIAVGSELLTPERSDTNSLWLTERLNEIGIDVMLKTIVGDDEPRLMETIKDAVRRSDIVITTGGLGPTEDDITRQVAAKAIGREVEYRDEIEAELRERFKSWGREMPEINKRQAYVIAGSEVLPNPNGSAVGMMLEERGKTLVILPGPPRENQPMFDGFVMPRLSEKVGDVVVRRRILKVSGMGESAVDEAAAPIYTQYPTVRTAVLFNRTEVEIHLYSRAATAAEAEAVLDELAPRLAEKLGIAVFTLNGETMEEVVGRMLADSGKTLSVAESCTGGLIGRRITEVPGSSDYFMEGFITYSNAAKVRALGVPEEIISGHGAVSSETAEAMAEGARRVSGADIAVSVTGIAGPGGGSEEKPVGTVFVGYSDAETVRSIKLVLPGDRYLVRWRASQAALDVVRRQILKAK
jgi:nicotinamide-nucleotide amidase